MNKPRKAKSRRLDPLPLDATETKCGKTAIVEYKWFFLFSPFERCKLVYSEKKSFELPFGILATFSKDLTVPLQESVWTR